MKEREKIERGEREAARPAVMEVRGQRLEAVELGGVRLWPPELAEKLGPRLERQRKSAAPRQAARPRRNKKSAWGYLVPRS